MRRRPWTSIALKNVTERLIVIWCRAVSIENVQPIWQRHGLNVKIADILDAECHERQTKPGATQNVQQRIVPFMSIRFCSQLCNQTAAASFLRLVCFLSFVRIMAWQHRDWWVHISFSRWFQYCFTIFKTRHYFCRWLCISMRSERIDKSFADCSASLHLNRNL